MRIGLVCPYGMDQPGGVQNHVLGLAAWLTAQGHVAGIIAPGDFPAEAAAGYGIDPARFTSTGLPLGVPYNGSIARIDLQARLGVAAWLDEGRFDLIHVHEPLVPAVALTAIRRATCPVVATFHAAFDRAWVYTTAGHFLADELDRINARIAVSPTALRVVRDLLGLDAEVIGNGFRAGQFTPSLPAGRWRGGERPSIVFVGRFEEPRKGFWVLAEALEIITSLWGEVDVTVIGPGEPVASLPGVTFRGTVSDAERDAALEHADIFVAPQMGRESFGIVLLEALAAGAHVVASDLECFRDLLTGDDGVVGSLFPPGDPDALARSVITLLRDPPPTGPGIERAWCFDWSRIGPLIVNQYDRALTDHAGHSLDPPRKIAPAVMNHVLAEGHKRFHSRRWRMERVD